MPREKWNVLLPKTIDQTGPASIADFCEFERIQEIGTSSEDLLQEIHRFDAIIVRSSIPELTSDLLDHADNLKVIAKHGVGLDSIDIDAASERCIVVCNTLGANTRSVAEHTISLLLATFKNIVAADTHVKNGGWDRHRYKNREFDERVLSLYGFGDIAEQTAIMASSLGFDCRAYDPYIPKERFPNEVAKVESQNDLFEGADVVSVHTPLTDETRESISSPELNAMSDEGIVVNTARGEIIDQAALIEALSNGTIAGAGLDVLYDEPPSRNDSILELDNVTLTPHVAGLTDEALERMSLGAAKNVQTVYEGGRPESTVNADRLP